MSYSIKITDAFEKDLKALAKKYPSIKHDLGYLTRELISNPSTGTPLGNNCYKIRIAISSKGRGKSGGGRVITFVQFVDNTIYMVAIYDKAEQENITDAILKERLSRL